MLAIFALIAAAALHRRLGNVAGGDFLFKGVSCEHSQVFGALDVSAVEAQAAHRAAVDVAKQPLEIGGAVDVELIDGVSLAVVVPPESHFLDHAVHGLHAAYGRPAVPVVPLPGGAAVDVLRLHEIGVGQVDAPVHLLGYPQQVVEGCNLVGRAGGAVAIGFLAGVVVVLGGSEHRQ